MSVHSSEKSNPINSEIGAYSDICNENNNLEKVAEDFVLSIFESVTDNLNKENEKVAGDYVSLIFKSVTEKLKKENEKVAEDYVSSIFKSVTVELKKENDKVAEDFVSSIFESVTELLKQENEKVAEEFVSTKKIKEEKYNENATASKFISSIIEEAENEVIVSKFIDSLIIEAEREIEQEKNKKNKLKSKKGSRKKKCVLISNDKNNFNENNPISTKTCEKKYANTCVKFDENNTPVKCAKFLQTENNIINASNIKTFNKDNKDKKFISCSSFKKKRNCLTKKKDRENNKKFNAYKSQISVHFRDKKESDKEKKQCEEKINLMKKHISVMKRRKEEIDKKITFIKNREHNINHIKQQKALLKKALQYNTEKKKKDLINIRQNIQKKKVAINNGIKQSSGKMKLEKIKQYKQIKEEKKEHHEKMKKIKEKNDSNVKRLIQKIRVLRAFNRNIIPQRAKNKNENNNKKNEKECKKNMEITNCLKKEILQLQSQENEYVNKLNKTKEKLFNFDSGEKNYLTVNKSYKKFKTQIINF